MKNVQKITRDKSDEFRKNMSDHCTQEIGIGVLDCATLRLWMRIDGIASRPNEDVVSWMWREFDEDNR